MARRFRTSLVVGFVFVNAACAAIAGLDYEICPDGDAACEGVPDSGATTNDTGTSDALNPNPSTDAGSDDVVLPDLPDANPCMACPRGTVQRVCVDAGCAEARRVFLSSTQSTAALGGPNGADQRCQLLAADAGLSGTWRAWISNSGSSPDDRFAKSNTVAYRLLDGTIVALNWDDLTDGVLAHAIDMDERGVRVTAPVEVWTGTRANGQSGGQKCGGFTNTNGEAVRVGIASIFTDAGWTEVYLQFCDRNDPHVYCFEQ